MILKTQFFTMTKSAKGNQFFRAALFSNSNGSCYSLMFDNIYASSAGNGESEIPKCSANGKTSAAS
jgi:hypothetical protein